MRKYFTRIMSRQRYATIPVGITPDAFATPTKGTLQTILEVGLTKDLFRCAS